MTVRSKKIGDSMKGAASLVIRQTAAARFAVVAYLPAGIDLTPMIYGRTSTLAEANELFDASITHVARLVGA